MRLEVMVRVSKSPDGFYQAKAQATRVHVNGRREYGYTTRAVESNSQARAASYALTEMAVALEKGLVKL